MMVCQAVLCMQAALMAATDSDPAGSTCLDAAGLECCIEEVVGLLNCDPLILPSPAADTAWCQGAAHVQDPVTGWNLRRCARQMRTHRPAAAGCSIQLDMSVVTGPEATVRLTKSCTFDTAATLCTTLCALLGQGQHSLSPLLQSTRTGWSPPVAASRHQQASIAIHSMCPRMAPAWLSHLSSSLSLAAVR